MGNHKFWHYFLWATVWVLALTSSCKKENDNSQISPDSDHQSNKKSCVEEAFPGIRGQIMSFVINGETITVEKIKDKYVFQGDIFLTEDQLISGSNKAAGLNYFIKPWKCNTVYYNINSNLLNKRDTIIAAMQHLKSNTNLKFVERTNQKNYVEFVRDPVGCASNLGMTGGRQEIWLADWAITGTVIHEICHAIGLIHEHSRQDRNSSVIILFKNIIDSVEYNFDIIHTFYKTDQFDFNSIMLYSSFAFSIDPGRLPTITKSDGSIFSVNRKILSNGDVEILDLIYPENPNDSVKIAGTLIEKKCLSATVELNATCGKYDTIEICGIYHGWYPNPESADQDFEVGRGAGIYHVRIIDLPPNTPYYVTPFAITECGIVFGNHLSFMVEPIDTTDVDGNVYHTVTIGDQVWMVENLRTTRLNDSTMVPGLYSLSSTYGAYYNFYAVNTGKLCPVGWHVPTLVDWMELQSYVDDNYSERAHALKATGGWWSFEIYDAYNQPTGVWLDYATNASGFTALPGGYIDIAGKYTFVGSWGAWWSSSPAAWDIMASYFHIISIGTNMWLFPPSNKLTGYSVRCLRDCPNEGKPTKRTPVTSEYVTVSVMINE